MNIIKLVIAASMSGLAGCQAVLPLPVSAPDMAVSHTKIDAALRGITVTTREDLLSRFLIDTPAWKTALQESVDRMAIFQPGAATQVLIAVEVIGFDTSANDDMESNAIARYQIMNKANGDILFSEDIISTGIAPSSPSRTVDTRIRESRSRAVRHNIAAFLKSLETAAIKLPATPARTATP